MTRDRDPRSWAAASRARRRPIISPAHGRRVTLARAGEIASGASGVNAGAIDSIGWGHAPDLQAHLTAGSVEIFKAVQLDLGEDIEFRQSGADAGDPHARAVRVRARHAWRR